MVPLMALDHPHGVPPGRRYKTTSGLPRRVCMRLCSCKDAFLTPVRLSCRCCLKHAEQTARATTHTFVAATVTAAAAERLAALARGSEAIEDAARVPLSSSSRCRNISDNDQAPMVQQQLLKTGGLCWPPLALSLMRLCACSPKHVQRAPI